MSRLNRLIKDARAGLDPWLPMPAGRAALIGAQCGAAEVEAALARLDVLSRERDLLPAWDGDSADDIWEAQKTLQQVLAHAPPGHAGIVARGLDSPRADTRMHVALALVRHDRALAGPALRAALARETDAGVRAVLASALARLDTDPTPDPA